MMKNRNLAKLTLYLCLVGGSILSTSCGVNSTPDSNQEELAKAKPYPLDVCLVIDKPLSETPNTYVQVYKGQEVKFCCLGCVKAFEANPEQFMHKIK